MYTMSPDKDISIAKEKLVNTQNPIIWRNVVILLVLHLGGFYGFYLRYTDAMLKTIIFAKICYIIAAMGLTAGAHRLWCHKAYKANTVAQILLMICNCVTYQNSIYTWSRDHRMHHKFTETDADPHNSKRGFFFSHMGWLFVKKHPEIKEKGKLINLSDLKSNKIVMFQHRNYHKLIILFGIIIPTVIPWYFWNESLKCAFFVAALYRYILSLHVTWSINSFAHMYGYKPYEKHINPSENTLTIYTTFGEGFHNYHHAFPWDYKASELGFDSRNLTTSFIDLLAWLGWATDLKTVPKNIIETRAHKRGDGSYTIQEENILKKSFEHTKNLIIFYVLFSIM